MGDKYLIVLPLDSNGDFINEDTEKLFVDLVSELGKDNVINAKNPYFFKEDDIALFCSRDPLKIANSSVQENKDYKLVFCGHGSYKLNISSNINYENEAIKNLARSIKKFDKDNSLNCTEVIFDSCYSGMEIKNVIPNVSPISDDNQCAPRKLSKLLKGVLCSGYVGQVVGSMASTDDNKKVNKEDTMVTFCDGVPTKPVNAHLRAKDNNGVPLSPLTCSQTRNILTPHMERIGQRRLIRANFFIGERQ